MVAMGKGDDKVKRSGINEAERRGAISIKEGTGRGKPLFCTYVHELEEEEEE